MAICSQTARAMATEISSMYPDALICPIAVQAFRGVSLDRGVPVGDVLGGLDGFPGQGLDCGGDHGESLACLARASRLDRGVPGQLRCWMGSRAVPRR